MTGLSSVQGQVQCLYNILCGCDLTWCICTVLVAVMISDWDWCICTVPVAVMISDWDWCICTVPVAVMISDWDLVYLYSACGCDDFRLGPGVFVQCLWLWWFQTGTGVFVQCLWLWWFQTGTWCICTVPVAVMISDWDLGVCLHYELRRKQIPKALCFNQWIDLRATYTVCQPFISCFCLLSSCLESQGCHLIALLSPLVFLP